MKAISLSDFYSVRAAATEIGIEVMALHQRIHRGTVTVERPFDRMILIHKDEVARLKQERESTAC